MPIWMRTGLVFSSLFIANASQNIYAVENYDFSVQVQPVPAHARLEHDRWFTWGASVLKWTRRDST